MQYLLVATILTGILQIIAGMLKLGNLLKFVSRSVLTGFINALAILIFMAQIPEFDGQGWEMYAMVAGGLGIIYLFPRLTKAVPSPLVCIIVLTLVAVFSGIGIPNIGDKGELPSTLPVFLLPDVPLNLETLMIVMIVLFGKYLNLIPMAALVAVMIMVAIGTFNWGSLKDLGTHPKSSSLIMVITVVVVVLTHNLAIGLGVGVLMSVFSFARKAALLVRVGTRLDESGEERTYYVEGNLFEAVEKMEQDSDLVVIGKRGEAADFAAGHLGSNLERVIRASVNPVLVARSVMKIFSCW